MREGEHRSIGEVLNLLKPEFDDITISKIRFLESQGLIDPVRTPSGYRMFGDGDIERLRLILRTQREQFLPLKVIKQRLDNGGADDLEPGFSDEPEAPVFDLGPTSASFSFDELASAAGISKSLLAKLEEAGVIVAHRTRAGVTYDDDALLIAKAATRLIDAGLEVRHLRAYKLAADREAGILEQLLAPVAHQRTDAGRTATLQSLGALVNSGEELRRALLRRTLRESLLH